ncbi:glycosyltransferase family 4 protein [bacterium]|nr:glycosyltransferase family 4 protein [bacterium]
MRIALVTHNFPPVVGSMSNWNQQIAELLASVGHDVTVYHFQNRRYPLPDIKNIRVKQIRVGKLRAQPGSRGFVYRLWRTFRITVRFLFILPGLARADLWQGSFSEELYLKVLLSLFRFVFRKPLCLAVNSHLFVHTHTGWKAKLRDGAMDLVLMSTSVIITSGEDLKLNILQEGIVSKTIKVLLPAVNCSEFHPGVPTGAFIAALKERSLTLPARPRLMFVGEMTEDNDPFEFLEVGQRFPKCGIVLVGDGPLKKEVRDRLAPIADHAIIAGFIPTWLLPSALAAADVVVLPFARSRGGVPFQVIQAMACGKPVVAYEIGHLGAVIEQGADGILVPQGDRKRLEAEVRRLLEFPSLCEKMGEAAARKVCKHWDLTHRREEYAKFYREFLDDWKKGLTSAPGRKAAEAVATEKSGSPKGPARR